MLFEELPPLRGKERSRPVFLKYGGIGEAVSNGDGGVESDQEPAGFA